MTFTTPALDGDGNPILDSEGKPVLNPVDLTGYTFALQVWPDPTRTGTAILDLTESAGITVTANLGLVTLRADIPTTITQRHGVYDLYARDASGAVEFPREGMVKFISTVTRPA